VLLAASLSGAWTAVAQQPPGSPFSIDGTELAQPGGADETGDVLNQADRQPAPNSAVDILYAQLVANGTTLSTQGAANIQLPPESLAFALQLQGDVALGLPGGQSLVFEMLVDSAEGGSPVEGHPEFTANYALSLTVNGGQTAAALSIWDPAQQSFAPVAPAPATAGGLLAVAEGSAVQDGVWAAAPLAALGGGEAAVVLRSRSVTRDGSGAITGEAADDWPNYGQLRFVPDKGWRAEAVNLLAGLAARSSCTLTAPGNVNVRSAPSTGAGQTRQISAGQTATAVAQTLGQDGYVWWRLQDGNWVRSDVVRAEEACQRLPQIQP
jgi:hypothetical protein